MVIYAVEQIQVRRRFCYRPSALSIAHRTALLQIFPPESSVVLTCGTPCERRKNRCKALIAMRWTLATGCKGGHPLVLDAHPPRLLIFDRYLCENRIGFLWKVSYSHSALQRDKTSHLWTALQEPSQQRPVDPPRRTFRWPHVADARVSDRRRVKCIASVNAPRGPTPPQSSMLCCG